MRGTHRIIANVVAFCYKHQVFYFYIYHGKKGSRLPMLMLETDKETKDIEFPIFLKIVKEVTFDKDYSIDYICRTLF